MKWVQWRQIFAKPLIRERTNKIKLVLKLLNLSEAEWESYEKKIKQVLHEIWETGAAKSTHGLDLNWPVASQKDNNQDWNNHDKNRIKTLEKVNGGLREQLRKETNNKVIWIVSSVVAISILSLTLLFCWLKLKKLKKY